MSKKDIVKVNPLNTIEKKKEFGQSLVASAEQAYQKQKSERLLSATQELMRQIDEAQGSLDWCKAVVNFLKEKLVALNAGEFRYEPSNNSIYFNRKDLNNTQPERERMPGLGGTVERSTGS